MYKYVIINEDGESMKTGMKKVLVIDDDVPILEVTKIILEDNGYNVQVLSDGGLIQQYIRRFQPNLLLLDIWIKGIDGGEITRKLKSHKSTQNLPIILVSANNDIEQIARTTGADDFLVKPFDIDTLIQKISSYF